MMAQRFTAGAVRNSGPYENCEGLRVGRSAIADPTNCGRIDLLCLNVRLTPRTAHRVVVIGGGLSGLTVANRVRERARTLRKPVELTVLEAKDRIGGVIGTERFDGFTLECGPDSFITNKPWGLDLCTRLGLLRPGCGDGRGQAAVVRGAERAAGCPFRKGSS